MDIKQNYWQLKCSAHPNSEVIYIKVNDIQENKSIFYCEICATTNYSFRPQNFVRIKQVIESNEDSIIFNWPPLGNINIQQKLIQIANEGEKQAKIIENQIYNYFNELRTKILYQINQLEKKQISKVYDLYEIETELKNIYQQISHSNQFKQILLNVDINQSEKEKQVRKFINELLSNNQQNKEEFVQLFQKKESIIKSVNYDIPNKMINEILQQIDEISIFQQQQKAQQYEVKENQIVKLENNNKINQLMSLHFRKSQYQESNYNGLLRIKYKNNNSIVFKNIISENEFSSCYLTNLILEKNKQYTFRFQVNDYINDGVFPNFVIGFVRDEVKDIIYCTKDYLCCKIIIKNSLYTLSRNKKGIQKVVKGNFRYVSIDQELELTISQNERILQLYDYPNKKDILELPEEQKQNLIDYQNLKFFISLRNNISIKMTAHYVE